METFKTARGLYRVGSYNGKYWIVSVKDNVNILARGPKWMYLQKMKELES